MEALQSFSQGSGNKTNEIKGLPLLNACEQLVYRKLQLGKAANFRKFVVLWLFEKFFPAKFGGAASLTWQKQAFRASFLRENRIFQWALQSFHCTVLPRLRRWLTGSAEKIDAQCSARIAIDSRVTGIGNSINTSLYLCYSIQCQWLTIQGQAINAFGSVKVLVKCWCSHNFGDDFFNIKGHREANKKILALQ